MKPFEVLRQEIRQTLIESHSQHRCMDGRIVDSESEDCYNDILNRIDDAMYNRDHCTGGTANRAYYNGVLADLRKRKRRLGKLYESPELQDKWTKVLPEDEWDRLVNTSPEKLIDYDLRKPNKEITKSRRDLKRFWNENADRSWFESDEIKCVHWLGWLRGMKKGVEALDRFLYYNQGSGLKQDELSSVGYVNSDPKIGGANMIGVLLDPRRITFAAKTDAWTEELHRASTYQRKKHKSSGLPKRPNAVAEQHVIFEKEDLGNKKTISEVICDNWNFDTIYVGDYWLDKREEQQVLIYAKLAGLNVLRFDGTEADVVVRKDDKERIEQEVPGLRLSQIIKSIK